MKHGAKILLGLLFSWGLLTASLQAKPLPKLPSTPGLLYQLMAQAEQLEPQAYLPVLLPNTEDQQKLAVLLAEWQERKSQSTSELVLVRQLFSQLHRKELTQYRSYTGLGALLQNGEYNCLSASALYGIILQELGFKVRYLETTNHLCILLTLSDGSHHLLEATEPLNGFISDQDKINTRIQQLYRQAQQVAVKTTSPPIFQVIGLKQLLGLSFYNQAAWQANHQNLARAEELISQGEQWYPAYRFTTFRRILAAR